MPLSPRLGGVNIALCAAVDLLGPRYQLYNSDQSKFYGLKLGGVNRSKNKWSWI